MKKTFFFVCIALIALTSIFSTGCKKDSTESVSMSAKIAGVAWNSILRVPTLTSNGTKLNITGTAADGKILDITINSPVAGTTYTAATQVIVAYTDGSSAYTINPLQAISVTLSKFDTTNKKVSGTFSFGLVSTSLSTLAVTEGKFENLSYTSTSK